MKITTILMCLLTVGFATNVSAEPNACARLETSAILLLDHSSNRVLYQGSTDQSVYRATNRTLDLVLAQSYLTNTLQMLNQNKCISSPELITAMEKFAYTSQCAAEISTTPKNAPTCEKLKVMIGEK